jgi:hypothetical protein
MNRAERPGLAAGPVDRMAPVRADEPADPFPTAEPAAERPIGYAQRRRTLLPDWFQERVRSERTPLLWLAATIAMGAAGNAGVPDGGLDPSWQAAINIGAMQNRRFGHDLLFTYGPWGFLDRPLLLSGWQFALGVLFATAAATAVFCVAYVCLKRTWSQGVAGAVAAALTVAMPFGEPGLRFLCAALVFAVLTLERRGVTRSGWRAGWPTALLAAFAALIVQVKFSEGIALLAVAGIVAISVRSLRALAVNVAAAAVAFTVSFLFLWLVAGQRLGDLVPWLNYSRDIANGYQEAMAIERADNVLGYVLAALLALVAVTVAVRMARSYGGPVGLGVVLLVVAMLEFGFKHGFTRHDGHEASFFTIAGFVLVALGSYARRPVAVLVTAALAVALTPGTLSHFDPFMARDRWRASAEGILNHNYRVTMLDNGKQKARGQYQLPANLVGESSGHPVSVDPWEATLPWAYSMKWNPVPVFQAYSAYTPSLDALNARAIVEAPSDQIVLRQDRTSIDDRNTRWETPRYLLALACNYTVGVNEQWWSLLRHGENRCSEPRNVGVHKVNPGEAVETPTVGPNEILVARFTPQPDGILTSLSHTVLKDWSPLIATADDSPFRLPKGLADGPLMVSFPATLGWADPFKGFHYKHLSFNKAGTLEFQVVAVR